MAEPTVWWWVRHGPTHRKTFTGWHDVPADLSDTARIARLAAELPSEAVVVSSDLLRAVQTADAIVGDRRRLTHAPGLREMNFGEWDGRHFSEIAEEHPELSRTFWETPGETAPPGGESWNDLAARVNAATDELAAPGHIVAVAHVGVILTQVQRALGTDPTRAIAQKIDNLSVTRITFDGTWRLDFVNHAP